MSERESAGRVLRRWAGEVGGFELARLADCGDPDGRDSAGWHFLTATAEALADSLGWELENGEAAEGLWADGVEAWRDAFGDEVTAVADGAPPIYTAEMWRAFVDLAAWQEDPSELGATSEDMETAARVCLYLIAERVAWAMLERWAERAEAEALDVEGVEVEG